MRKKWPHKTFKERLNKIQTDTHSNIFHFENQVARVRHVMEQLMQCNLTHLPVGLETIHTSWWHEMVIHEQQGYLITEQWQKATHSRHLSPIIFSQTPHTYSMFYMFYVLTPMPFCLCVPFLRNLKMREMMCCRLHSSTHWYICKSFLFFFNITSPLIPMFYVIPDSVSRQLADLKKPGLISPLNNAKIQTVCFRVSLSDWEEVNFNRIQKHKVCI